MKNQRLTQKEIEDIKRITREERIKTWKRLLDRFGLDRCMKHSYSIKKAIDMALIGQEIPQ